MRVDSIVKYMLLLIGMVVLLWGLYRAQVFLIPLTFAAVFSMLLLPVSAKLEDWGCSRVWSSLAGTLLFVAAVIGVLLLLSGLASQFAEQLPAIKQKALDGYREFQQKVETRWGMELPNVTALQSSDKQTGNATTSPKSQPPAEEEGSGQSSLPAGISAVAGTIIQFIRGIVEMLGSALLAIVSTFALLVYRGKLREFMLRLFSDRDRDRVQDIIERSSRVGLYYLWGQILLVFVLAGLYAAGFLLIGLQNAFFLAVFTAVFSLIPYLGNVIGIAVPLLVAFVGDGFTMVLWVLAVFAVAQFVESYILEPMLVGSEVKLNPFVTLLVVTAGGLLWGIPGLILAVPIVGVARIVCTAVEPLHPFAFLISDED